MENTLFNDATIKRLVDSKRFNPTLKQKKLADEWIKQRRDWGC